MKKLCEWCQGEFTTYQGARFDTRTCYDLWRRTQKKCSNCHIDGGPKCRYHAREKSRKSRKLATPQELKARSMQSLYRAATDKSGTLTLDQARDLINNPPACPYCKKPIPWNKFSIDHKQPRARGGSSNPENLVWVDWECNVIKGSLTEQEFRDLLIFFDEHPEVRKILITRLKTSGFIYKR